ncbi:unnamed protein product [Moneuplotes crassus]|uniref:Uncharacterized protein n=1 Tax=Euplotes crassus TaxID=5936 RepID=A0AAD1XV33_EUPCR|nr:unnamed protein product [Moneuplotes crassus]
MSRLKNLQFKCNITVHYLCEISVVELFLKFCKVILHFVCSNFSFDKFSLVSLCSSFSLIICLFALANFCLIISNFSYVSISSLSLSFNSLLTSSSCLFISLFSLSDSSSRFLSLVSSSSLLFPSSAVDCDFLSMGLIDLFTTSTRFSPFLISSNFSLPHCASKELLYASYFISPAKTKPSSDSLAVNAIFQVFCLIPHCYLSFIAFIFSILIKFTGKIYIILFDLDLLFSLLMSAGWL